LNAMKRILVIRLGAIGDVVLTSPAILNLKISNPGARILLLTRSKIAKLASMFSGVDEIIEFPAHASLRDLFRMAEHLDKIGFDMIVDLHGNLRSKYLMKHIAAGVKVQYPKRRFERWASVRLHKLNPDPPHTIDLYNMAVQKAGSRIYARRPVIRLKPSERMDFDLTESLPHIAIAPGASFPSKQWPPDRFRKLSLEIFKRNPANVVLLLADIDEQMESLRDEIPLDRLKIFVNAELAELAQIIAGTDLLICNDSALAHIGSAVGTPVIALFGPTHPTLGFSPRGLRDCIMQVDEPCRPCSLHGRRACYRDHQYCFDRISIDDVMEKVTERIKSKTGGEKALFIDRDGTLIREKGYLRDPGEVEPEYKAVESVRMARDAGYKIIGLTNQSGVARGYYDEEMVRLVNQRVLDIFASSGAPIDEIHYCPHYIKGELPQYAIECSCRKPSAGMLELACLRHNINPFNSFVIGDKMTDIQLAAVSGGRGILVRTGFGKQEEKLLQIPYVLGPEIITENFHEAVKYVVRGGGISGDDS